MSHHIVGKGYNINISRSLSVSEKSTLHPVSSRKYAKFRISYAGSAVVVRVDGKDNILSVFKVLAHILYLAGKNMGHGNLYRRGKVDDNLFVLRRLPDIDNSVANL